MFQVVIATYQAVSFERLKLYLKITTHVARSLQLPYLASKLPHMRWTPYNVFSIMLQITAYYADTQAFKQLLQITAY